MEDDIVGPKAWRESAETYPDMSFKAYREQLIHETPDIEDFLLDTRGDQFIISAPKGFGKTLLLVAKCIQIREISGGSVISVGNEMVDRPPASALPNYSDEEISKISMDFYHWKNLWKLSVQLAAVKSWYHHNDESKLRKMSCHPFLYSMLNDKDGYMAATSIFVALLSCHMNLQIDIVQNSGNIPEYYRLIQSQIIIAIDNVDEFFKPSIESASKESSGTKYYRSISNDLWTVAQLSLISSVYDLSRTNSHVKLYCTIRREAFLQLHEFDSQFQQIRGATLEIQYASYDYRQIFSKNVDLMRAKSLCEPKSKEPITKFLGARNETLLHSFTRRTEDAFEYILRHTFYRPRDLMLMGRALASLTPSRRLDSNLVRQTVWESSKDIVRALYSEMRSFFELPDLEKLLRRIDRNALTSDDIERITREYLADCEVTGEDSDEALNPFCVLAKIGMLGNIERDLGGPLEPRQNFLKPHEIVMKNHCLLPNTEEYYLVHPALDETIKSANAGYYRNFHSSNVIGDGYQWVEPIDSYFVLVGDLCGFSRIMATEFYVALSAKLYQWAKASCDDIAYFEIFGGDSILMLDRDPVRLLDSAKNFVGRALAAREANVNVRFGGACGPIAFQRIPRRLGNEWVDSEIPLGQALRAAARIEPFSSANIALLSGEFMDRWPADMPSPAAEADPGTIALEFDPMDRHYLIRKNPLDEPFRTRLFACNMAPEEQV